MRLFWTFLNTVKFSWLEGLKGSVLQNEEETSFWICRIYVTPTRHLTDDLFSGCTCLCQKKKKSKHSWYSLSKIVLFIKAFFKVFHCWWIFPKAAAFSWVIHDTFIPISRVESIPTRDNAKIVPIFECQWNGIFFSDSIDFYPHSQCFKT